MVNEIPETVERWPAKRRAALALSILRGETSVQEAARKHRLTVAEAESRKERFRLAAEDILGSQPKDEELLKEERTKQLDRKIGGSGHGHHGGGDEALPFFRPEDVRRGRQKTALASWCRVCRFS